MLDARAWALGFRSPTCRCNRWTHTKTVRCHSYTLEIIQSKQTWNPKTTTTATVTIYSHRRTRHSFSAHRKTRMAKLIKRSTSAHSTLIRRSIGRVLWPYKKLRRMNPAQTASQIGGQIAQSITLHPPIQTFSSRTRSHVTASSRLLPISL